MLRCRLVSGPLATSRQLQKSIWLALLSPGLAQKVRPETILQRSVAAWVEKKFTSRGKVATRERAWPGLSWQYIFVHAVVREPLELSLIANHDIKVVPFHAVLHQLKHVSASQRGGAGTDISEIVEYFSQHGAGAT